MFIDSRSGAASALRQEGHILFKATSRTPLEFARTQVASLFLLNPVRKNGRLVVISRLLPELAKTLDTDTVGPASLDSS